LSNRNSTKIAVSARLSLKPYENDHTERIGPMRLGGKAALIGWPYRVRQERRRACENWHYHNLQQRYSASAGLPLSRTGRDVTRARVIYARSRHSADDKSAAEVDLRSRAARHGSASGRSGASCPRSRPGPGVSGCVDRPHKPEGDPKVDGDA